MDKIQLTKKQIQVLDECVMVELGFMVPVAASTRELQTLHELLESLYRGAPDVQKENV
jgi:hypothetical protein